MGVRYQRAFCVGLGVVARYFFLVFVGCGGGRDSLFYPACSGNRVLSIIQYDGLCHFASHWLDAGAISRVPSSFRNDRFLARAAAFFWYDSMVMTNDRTTDTPAN